MKRLVLVLLSLSPVSLAVAQVRPAIGAGAKSLNFTFGGFGGFGLTGTGPAGGVGVSSFLSGDAAVRVGLQVGSHKTTLTWTGSTAGNDGEESGLRVGASVDYLKYMGTATSRVRPYVGGGVGVMRVSNKSMPAVATGGTVTETKNDPGGISTPGFAAPGTTFDLHANFGAEFFLFNELSIAGEYGLNIFNRTSPSDMEEITGGTTVTTKGNPVTNILGFGAAGATVRIYF